MTKKKVASSKTRGQKTLSFALTGLLVILIGASIYRLYTLGFGGEIDHPLIGQTTPDMHYPIAMTETNDINNFSAFINQDGIKLVSFNASWCGMCRVKHGFIMDFSQSTTLRPPMAMIALRDSNRAVNNWLNKDGNPYDMVVSDLSGDISKQWQVTGVPSLFVLSSDGTICKAYQGIMTEGQLKRRVNEWQSTCMNT